MANLTDISLQTEEAQGEWWMSNIVPKFKKDQKYKCDFQLSTVAESTYVGRTLHKIYKCIIWQRMVCDSDLENIILYQPLPS